MGVRNILNCEDAKEEDNNQSDGYITLHCMYASHQCTRLLHKVMVYVLKSRRV